MFDDRSLKQLMKSFAGILFHVALVALSAGIAFSLPVTVSFIARNFFYYWTPIENQKTFLMSVEIVLAISLLLFFNYVGGSLRDRRIAKMARAAGLLHVFPKRRLLGFRRIQRLKSKQGFARDVLVICSTGFRTFVDPNGDLHRVLKNCREAKIMLLNPYSEGASARARSILNPEVTPGHLRDQIKASIKFVKGLKAVQKNVKLKLYEDPPFLRLAILGDYVWLKHYHPGLDAETMPEYVFRHDQDLGGLYTPIYQYFMMRWETHGIPDYDLDTDELVYRDGGGKERARVKFDEGCLEVEAPENPWRAKADDLTPWNHQM